MKTPTLILSCALLLGAPLFARPKIDVLVMNNGDRFTCEIKGLDEGILYVGFDYIKGTTQVDWLKVHHIESKQLFLVKTEGGTVYTGTLSTAEIEKGQPMTIEVVESSSKQTRLERPTIVEMDQTSEHFWQRFNGEINTGLTYTKGNQSTQYNLSSDVSYPRERWQANASFNSTSVCGGTSTRPRRGSSSGMETPR